MEGIKQIATDSIQVIIADFPYSMTQNEWDYFPMEKIIALWEEFLRVLKPDGTIIAFSKQPFGAKLICQFEQYFRYEEIWEKEKATLQFEVNNRSLPIHENILIFSKKYPNKYNVLKEGKKGKKGYKKLRTGSTSHSSNYGKDSKEKILTKSENGDRFPTSILRFGRDHSNKGIHPTQKPVELMVNLIEKFSNNQDVILDVFMGSASTYIACIITNRICRGFEIDSNMYNLSWERIRTFQKYEKDSFKKPRKIAKNQSTLTDLIINSSKEEKGNIEKKV